MSLSLLVVIFFCIALIYASVGFGGGSSYIAMLLIAGVAVPDVRLTALICNIIVVGGSTYNFVKVGHIPWRKIIPLIIFSVPLAFIGGMIELNTYWYKIIASIALVIAAVLMLRPSTNQQNSRQLPQHILYGIGSSIGFISGIIGIGGGIFLAPILHLIKWETIKTISATASLFILVNSLAGIIGQMTNGVNINGSQLLILGTAVFFGGQVGNHLNLKVLKPELIRYLTAVLVGFVGIRILITHIN